ncbi:hypothetical protein HMPREF1510_0438 [Streptococcus sp. ACC21]|nr:hypothetical protein HMPREF1510_0438 [Streptococcus sp. ACC21]
MKFRYHFLIFQFSFQFFHLFPNNLNGTIQIIYSKEIYEEIQSIIFTI